MNPLLYGNNGNLDPSMCVGVICTLPEIDIVFENSWLQGEFPFGARPILTGYLSCKEGIFGHSSVDGSEIRLIS